MGAGVTDRGNFYQQQEKDIQRYIEKGVDFLRLYLSVEDVTKKCGGIFFYAFCVIKELNDLAHLGKVTQMSQLNDFPDDINESFQASLLQGKRRSLPEKFWLYHGRTVSASCIIDCVRSQKREFVP